MSDDVETSPRSPIVDAAEAAFNRAHEKHVAASAAAKDASITGWLEAFEGEHAAILQQVLPEVIQHPDMPPIVRDVLAGLTTPEHQTQALLGMAAVYAIVSGFVGAVIAPAITEVASAAYKLKPTVPMSPNELANAVVRGWIDEATGAKEASLSGTNPERFGLMVNVTGNPPGPAALMEALRRGIIDNARFDHGIRESDTRPEWIDVLHALRYSPPPPSTAIAAAVQGHLDKTESSKFVAQGGIDPDNYEWLFETAGRPPGIMELAELLNRGEISEATLRQAIKESDIKDKYIDEIVKLRRKIPPMRTVVAAVHQGVLSESDGVRKLQELGYDARDAAMLAKEGTNLKHAVNKQLTQAQVHGLYAARMITRAAAATMIGNLGYDATETEFILALADHERHMRAMTTAINRVHSRYVAYHLDRTAAVHALDQIGVDPQGRTDLLGTWDDERAANAPVLTLAQLDGMIRRNLISQTVYRDHVLRLGYEASVVPKLYALAWPPAAKEVPEWKL